MDTSWNWPEVSSHSLQRRERNALETDWSRLIPGAAFNWERRAPAAGRCADRSPAASTTSKANPAIKLKVRSSETIDNLRWRTPSKSGAPKSSAWAAFKEFSRVVTAWSSSRLQWPRLENVGSKRNVLIIGAGSVGRRLAEYLQKHPEMGRSVRGLLDDKKFPGKNVVGRTSDLAALSRVEFVDEVILAAPHDRELTLRLLREAQLLRLDVKIAPDLFGCESSGEPERIGGTPLISLHEERLPVAGLRLKRVLDIVGSAVLLILLSPALAILALLIRIDSPGNVLYVAPRAGRKGKPFPCCKFRTMVQNADALKSGLREKNQREGPIFKIADDPRITRMGRLLRRYSLDELPQLWNVLKGEMSLVGPRPHPLDDFSAYAIEHLPRLDVTPGITGLWQVTARRDPSFQAGMNLDKEYIRRWSLGMDFKILLKTAGAVLRGSGD